MDAKEADKMIKNLREEIAQLTPIDNHRAATQ